jgi:hypothetical protein
MFQSRNWQHLEVCDNFLTRASLWLHLKISRHKNEFVTFWEASLKQPENTDKQFVAELIAKMQLEIN